MKNIFKCFPHGKMKALTMSYDDGREYDIPLIEIFNKYNIKATFHLNSNTFDDDPISIKNYGKKINIIDFPKVYSNHEVACHTVDHIPLDMCPLTQAVMQIANDRQALEKIMKYPVRGLSYPYGAYNKNVKNMLIDLGIEYSRTVEVTESFDLPDDFYEWKGTCRHTSPKLMKLCDQFLNTSKKNKLQLMYVWGHSYEFERDNTWNIIEDFCRKAANKKDIWYATNIEIIDYLKSFNNLKFSFDGKFVYNPNYNSVWINMDNEIYEIKGGETVYL